MHYVFVVCVNFTLIRVLIRFNRSSKSNCDPLGFPLGEELGLGSEQSSDPLQICACGRGQGAGASEWASKLGVPAVGSYRRPVPTGHGAVRAGARGPSVSLRRTGAARTADKIFARCTLHVPSARRSRSLPPPHLHLRLQAAVTVPPLSHVPAHSPAARRLTAAEQRLCLC